MKRLTLEDARGSFSSKGYELLEKEYKNSKTKMSYICNKHPENVQYIRLNDINNGHGCKYCKIENSPILGVRLSFKEVEDEFNKNGYRLLDSEYVSNKKKMKYECSKHPDEELFISYNNLKSGTRCKFCSQEKSVSSQRNDFDLVKKSFFEVGLEVIQEFYVSSGEPIQCRCPKHPNKTLFKRYSDVKNGLGCQYCSYEARSGDKNWKWKGGITPLNTYLREYTNDWKAASLKKHNYRCFITSSPSKDIEIHHTKPFHMIRDEILQYLKIDVRDNISQYTKEELLSIVDELKTRHKSLEGIPLKTEIHRLFHKIYGSKTTLKDLEEFKKRYNAGEFNKAV